MAPVEGKALNMRLHEVDYLVVGAGMAGASAGYELAARGRVVVLERETQPGYHSTGRSAALYTQSYGNATVRALTTGSRDFLQEPPTGFCEQPILTPRGVLYIGRAEQAASLERVADEAGALVVGIQRLDAARARTLVPILRAGALAAGGVLEPNAMDIDIHGLLQGYLRGLVARGGRIVTNTAVTVVERIGGCWQLHTRAGIFAAPVLVNAAGAWCDELAALAGARPVGLVPKRRTVITFDGPKEMEFSHWPMVADADEAFYFKPDADQLLASPADETPSEPGDAQPEELDIAVAVDYMESATALEVRRLNSRWAGLRSFVADNTPVAGYDSELEGLFWLAGQGGYGIQSAPALARTAASLIHGGGIPPDLRDLGVTVAALTPDRCR